MADNRKTRPSRARHGKTAALTAPRVQPPTVETPVLDLTQACARFTESVNRVTYRGERILIQKHGRPVAALVPVEDLALIRELEDRIDLADARKALAEAKGKLVPWETVKRNIVRLSVARIAEMEEFWRFMRRSRQVLAPGSFRTP